MAELKQVLQGIGCTRVATLLNSGNAVVEHVKIASAKFAERVAAAIAQHFGFDVPVIIKSSAEFSAVVSGNKLSCSEVDYPKLLVAFAQDKKTITSLQALAALIKPPEKLQLESQAAYLYCASGILESHAATSLLGKLGQAVTTRNWATVLKLHALASEQGSEAR